MSKRTVRTRFTTGCGHSWTRKYPRWTVDDLAGATTDCTVCGKLLIIPGGQFLRARRDCIPAEVHMPLLHRWLNQQNPDWPADGAGTGHIGFDAEDERVDEYGMPIIDCVIVTTERTTP